MARTLRTPPVHRLLVSPLGVTLGTAPFERLKTRSLADEFAVERARAAADVTDESSDSFLAEAGGTTSVSERTRDRIDDALAAYRDRRREYEDVTRRWNDAFWGDDDRTSESLVAVERERRRKADRRARPEKLFGFLADDHIVPPVKFDVPDPETALSALETEVDAPAELYSAPDPAYVERSRELLGPDTVEYFVRFRSPSPFVDTRASARVYEPVDARGGLPTFVYGSGYGMLYDQLDYWPEEDAIGRALAPEGVRVVLLESPWHGRRERLGRYSGEPYLAGAPVAAFQLYAAQTAETAAFVEWARSLGAPTVGVGGVSLGGIVALHVAGRCGRWPEPMRPDFVAPVAATASIDRVLVESSLSKLLGVDTALRDAGWTDDRLAALAPLLNPPEQPGLSPDSVYPFSGTRDEMAPYGYVDALLESWSVPATNRTEWDAGHFGAYLRAIRRDAYRDRVLAELGGRR